MSNPNYDRSVFINCPFDDDFKPIFDAIVFAIHDCGFVARCAREADDSGEIRVKKILNIIKECRYGIHDLSRTDVSIVDGERLPRFNMPLELGYFLGAREYGSSVQKRKVCLILDEKNFRYQKTTSDLAGQDIRYHGNDPAKAISEVCDWLDTNNPDLHVPGGTAVNQRYQEFQTEFSALCSQLRRTEKEIQFLPYTRMIGQWLKETYPAAS